MSTLYTGARLLAGGDGRAGGPPADALLVHDGRVAWVGPAPDAPPARRRVRLPGGWLLPAFVDSHAHVTETGLLLDGVDLAAARSLGELLDLVATAARNRPGHAVLGHGWDELRLAEGRPPTAAELARAAPGAVVYLSRVDVHSAVVSPALAERAGLPGLAGWDGAGRVERDAHHAARHATRYALAAPERRRLQVLALSAAAAAGIVDVHEMSAPHVAPAEDLAMLLARGDDRSLPDVVGFRGELAGSAQHARAIVAGLGLPPGARFGGLAGDLNADGSVGSRTAAFRADYLDAPGLRGHRYLSEYEIAAHVVACTRAGLAAGFHVIGDAAVDAVLAGFARAERELGPAGTARLRGGGHRLEHLEAIDAAGIATLARLGVSAAVQPAFDAAWGGPDGMYARRLGAQRAVAMNPFATMLAAGVRLTLGSDSPVTPFDPWGAVRGCTRHRTAAQRIPAADAFAAHAVPHGAAPTRGQVTGAGTLRVGDPATFAVWAGADDAAPRAVLDGLAGTRDAAPPARCLLTVLRGAVLHDPTGAAAGSYAASDCGGVLNSADRG